MFPYDFIRSKGKRCNKRKGTVLAKFRIHNKTMPNGQIHNALVARNECENYCAAKEDCWGCSVDCEKNCHWNALQDCGVQEDYSGIIDGDITQKPGNV